MQTLSYAGTYGLATQANLVGQEFSLLVTIFYIGYLVAQYPANLLMQKYPTGKFITISFCLWGMSPVLSLASRPECWRTPADLLFRSQASLSSPRVLAPTSAPSPPAASSSASSSLVSIPVSS